MARSCVVALLAACLCALPGLAAVERPMGMVVHAARAHLGHADAATGATLYPGDAVDTEDGGALRLRVGASQLYLLGSSAAALAQDASTTRVTVERGTVGFSSSGADQFELETPAGILRGANQQAVYGQVEITGPAQMVVSAFKGSLILDNYGEIHTIAEGTAYRIAIADDAGGGSPAKESDPKHAKRRRLAVYLIGAAVGGVVMFEMWHEMKESTEDPE